MIYCHVRRTEDTKLRWRFEAKPSVATSALHSNRRSSTAASKLVTRKDELKEEEGPDSFTDDIEAPGENIEDRRQSSLVSFQPQAEVREQDENRESPPAPESSCDEPDGTTPEPSTRPSAW
eukprot:CAMPEP_0116574296 /NCGR_PEP_ID=MMETSP0397-20121206/19309_1 /TAXON_ID=216820 /ORGANISM="Cyclophora tenuis, Strain ECT3854" /LENGTH=120 /DNA_ID=CAMNT_0004103033 /DNA_START=78 /DNA_END=437 /DNA_ORIENTATION=+